jgi:hypothetical protein
MIEGLSDLRLILSISSNQCADAPHPLALRARRERPRGRRAADKGG